MQSARSRRKNIFKLRIYLIYMKKTLKVMLLKAPLLLLVLSAFIAGIYAAANNMQGVSWGAPVLTGLIIVLYAIGMYLERRK